jgi:MoxR-like ATPase/predicted Mrr-cat superfamily restriction endonuclease
MSDKQYNELKRLIIEKNPQLITDIENIEKELSFELTEAYEEIGFYDLNAGRSHIVRDICYLLSNHTYTNPNDLYDSLRENIGENDSYFKAYYQRSTKNSSPAYNLNSARTLGLVGKNNLTLTALGKKLVEVVKKSELFTHHYSNEVKKFFFGLAVQNPSIQTAMQILRRKRQLRFYSPTCNRTNRVFWKKSLNETNVLCEHDDYPECKKCDHDFINHIKESSLPFETLKTGIKGHGFVFWMCSRVTPMHLTGKDPGYSGNTIYWDKKAADELGDSIKMLDDETETVPRIWKITPGEPEKSEKYWPIYTEKGFIGIGWVEFKRDFREFNSQNELNAALNKTYGESKSQSAKMIWDFANEMKAGDYVIANRGKNEVIGIGVIQSDYIGPNHPENLNLTDYPHLRKVDWKIIDNIEVSRSFDRKTITELEGKRWNEIISTYARMNPEFKIELLEKIYAEFKEEYLDRDVGQEHLKAYEDESEKITKAYKDVMEKINQNIDATDEILYELVPHKGKSIVGFIANIKAFFEKTYEIKPDKFPEIANNYFNTIHDFIETDDSEIQEEIINKFASSEYSKGFGAGTLTPILFFINHNYPLINNKTVDTVTFLSKIMGESIKLDMELNHYVENKDKFNNFLINLSEYLPDLYDFAIFDIFCHWLCDKNLGFYAKGKPLPLLGNTKKISEFEPVFLKPELIETKLKIAPKIKEQVCGTLNSSKHVMITGAPGTGKTNLAEDVCKVAESHKFTKGYVLTTATSDWTTFDTIGGYMPSESGKLIFEEGKFLQAIKEDKWLIIDEINRADIDKAFGQLFTVLSGQGVELPFKINGKSVRIQPTEEIGSYYDSETATYRVGKNWRILSTMNVYDKDYLFEMSYAFMRRFTFIYIDLPVDEEYKKLIDSWCGDLDESYIHQIHQLLDINPHREIGPAIFKDVIEYVAAREEIGSNEHILEDAVLSYIMPQFEGLEKTQILEIWKILKYIFIDSDELKARLEEISTIPLDDAK